MSVGLYRGDEFCYLAPEAVFGEALLCFERWADTTRAEGGGRGLLPPELMRLIGQCLGPCAVNDPDGGRDESRLPRAAPHG